MRLYLSGEPPIKIEKIKEFGVENFLVSYFYRPTKERFKEYIGIKNIFLDSGAFSAMNSGKKIILSDYIKFIHEVKDYISEYAGLDVIGDAEATKRNIEDMEKEGLSPLPTFHIGSDINHLYPLIEKYKHIALGGMAGAEVSQNNMFTFLDRVFNEIYKRHTDIKVHGFACSGFEIMKNYPWYSVDSTSWLGSVIFARPINGVSSKKIIHDSIKENPELDGDKKGQRELLLKQSIQEYAQMQKTVTEYHSKQDWQYRLTAQQELF